MYVDYYAFHLIEAENKNILNTCKTRYNNTKGQVSFFQKGGVLGVVSCGDKSYKLIAPANGYYSYIHDRFLYSNGPCCAFVNDDSAVSYYGLRFDWTVENDPFTNERSIKWKSVWSYGVGGYFLSSVVINLNIKNNIPTVIISWDKQIKAKKGDSITLLFALGEQKRMINIPVKSRGVAISPIWEDDLDYMLNYDFIGIRFIFSDGSTLDRFNRKRDYHSNGRGSKLSDDPYYRFITYVRCYLDILDGINGIKYQKDKPIQHINDIETETREPCYVYLMKDTTNGFHKIGISNKPEYRERTLQSEKPTIDLICAKKYPSRLIAESIESALHKAYGEKRLRGEWFDLSQKDVNDIIQSLS